MFARLFAESGLSLDRLKSLLEVSATASIAKAADRDPVRQSQYSRQIKELEAFFRVKLIERQGKGMRLTSNGKELARISRFFLLGLSNFQRGCLNEEQTFRIGASATFIQLFLLPALSGIRTGRRVTRYVTEVVGDDEIERRLHDLTLDFGVITRATISRPLQTKELGEWGLKLWVPRSLFRREAGATRAFQEGRLPLVLARKELDSAFLGEYEPRLVCDSFLEAMVAVKAPGLATILPNFLVPGKGSTNLSPVRIPVIDAQTFHFRLGWNPRLLRLNPHAARTREFLAGIFMHSPSPIGNPAGENESRP